MKKLVIATLALGASLTALTLPRAARACSRPAPWEFGTFIRLGGGYGPTTQPAQPGLTLILEGFGLPDYEVYRDRLSVEVVDERGTPIPGRIQPTRRFNVVRWMPSGAPLALGGRYRVTMSLTDPVEQELVVGPRDGGEVTGALRMENYDFTILGRCTGEPGPCGGCSQREALGSERRIRALFRTTLSSDLRAPDVLAQRVAVGPTLDEARAALRRTPYEAWREVKVLDVGRLSTWSSDQVCAVVELRDAFDDLLYEDQDCWPVDREGMSFGEGPSLGGDDLSVRAEGCSAAGGGQPSTLALLLLGALPVALRRRSG